MTRPEWTRRLCLNHKDWGRICYLKPFGGSVWLLRGRLRNLDEGVKGVEMKEGRCLGRGKVSKCWWISFSIHWPHLDLIKFYSFFFWCKSYFRLLPWNTFSLSFLLGENENGFQRSLGRAWAGPVTRQPNLILLSPVDSPVEQAIGLVFLPVCIHRASMFSLPY